MAEVNAETKTVNSRSSQIQNCSIVLTEKEPLARLKQLCRQGKYRFQFSWDRFQNGHMCECQIYYSTSKRGRREQLIKVAQFVETDSHVEAQRVVAEIILSDLGLFSEDSNDTRNIGNELITSGLKAVTNLITQATRTSSVSEEDSEESEGEERAPPKKAASRQSKKSWADMSEEETRPVSRKARKD